MSRGTRRTRRGGSRARPQGLQRLCLHRRAAHLAADVQGRRPPLRARQARALSRRCVDRLRRCLLRRRPVLLPGGPERLSRSELLRGHGAAPRRPGRLRVGVRDRAPGRPPRAEGAPTSADEDVEGLPSTSCGVSDRPSGANRRALNSSGCRNWPMEEADAPGNWQSNVVVFVFFFVCALRSVRVLLKQNRSLYRRGLQ